MRERLSTHRTPACGRSSEAAYMLAKLLQERRHELRHLCVRWSRGHGADAEDLLAEACLRALQAAAGWEQGVESPLHWLSAIVKNLARDRWRTSERVGHTEAVTDALPGWSHDLLDSIASKRLLEQTLAQLRCLPAAQRHSLVARANGDDYEAIAEAVGTSRQNARKLVQTARHRLRKRLSGGLAAGSQAT